MIKVIPIKAQAGIVGFESPAAEYTQLSIDLDALLIDHPSATYVALAQGESMTLDGIFDGDLLIVDRSAIAEQDDIIVANLNGEFVCKRLDKINARLLSGSPNYAPYSLSQGDEFQVEGVVTRSIRLHRPLSKTL